MIPTDTVTVQAAGTHNGRPYPREALDLVAAGKVTPMVEVFNKEHVAEAVEKTAKGEVRFRAVVT